MRSQLLQPDTECRIAFYDDLPERGEDLGFIRHRLDALAYARALCGLRPKDELEYRRLCEREWAILEAIHGLGVQ
jgi:hypothetical protein